MNIVLTANGINLPSSSDGERGVIISKPLKSSTLLCTIYNLWTIQWSCLLKQIIEISIASALDECV